MSTSDLSGLNVALYGVQDDLRDSVHFLRAITQLAANSRVIAHKAIYTDKGIKLVEGGARIHSRLYDSLVQAPLREAIDNHLMVDTMVSVASIEAEALVQCETMPWLQRAVQALGGAGRLLAPVRSMPLSTPIAFKLTLMREQRPAFYAHSLQLMLVALYLGVESGWSERECVPLAVAGLLHDIGMLYLPPSWTDPEYRLRPEERKQLIAHSVTGMHILRAEALYPLSVSLAVLEHHERMDGSGYPRGLQGEEISPMGQILMLAEVVAAFHEKYAQTAGPRLSLMLRMNHRHYPAALVRIILPLLGSEVDTDLDMGQVRREVQTMGDWLEQRFAQWLQLCAQGSAQPPSPPLGDAVQWLDTRLKDLQKELAQTGSHPQQLADLLESLQDDSQGMGELALLHHEALWQLGSIADECLRRWPQLLAPSGPLATDLANWCLACTGPVPASA